MNFFNKKTTWSNTELIPLKVCIASAYLILGSFFPDFFQRMKIPLFILFLVTVVWSVYLWLKKMRTENK